MAFESNLALFFSLLGFTYFLEALDRKNTKKYVFSAFFLALSMYTYVAYRLIWILFFLATFLYAFLQKEEKHNRFFSYFKSLFSKEDNLRETVSKTMILCIFFLLPLLPSVLSQSGTARFDQVSIFSSEGISARVNEKRNFCFLTEPTLLPKVCKIFFNRPIELAAEFTDNYLNFLFPSFSFIQGDKLTYLSPPDFASFFTLLGIFYLIGLATIIRQEKTVGRDFFLILFFISPIPSSFVGEPQIVRGSLLLPMVSICVAVGLTVSAQFIKEKLDKIRLYARVNNQVREYALPAIFLCFFSLATTTYLLDYFVIYNHKYAGDFYLLSKNSVNFILEKQNEYEKIYFTREFPDAHIALAFYGAFDPVWYQNSVIRPEDDHFGFSHPIQLGNYYFGDDILHKYLCQDQEKVLFVTRNHKLTPTWEFKDFSGVHTEVQLFDTEELRERLVALRLLDIECPKE